ncbi:MAG: tetratricopeptide repeat protein, partial [Verrucomicrobiota bacterium]
KIADILMARGELEEALRILTEDLLPVFERLGDVHQRAVTQGKIADILKARGELEEALRIRKEEELAVYERLGDVRSLIVGRTKLALLLIQRGRGEDEQEIIGLLVWSFFEARRRGFPEADTIMGILGQLGVTPELLATIARGPAPPAGGLPHDSPPFPI